MPWSTAPRCIATARATGEQCGKAAMTGATVCKTHGGANPIVRRRGLLRAMVLDWKLDLPEVDPIDQFKRLLSATAMKQAKLEWLIRAATVDDGDAEQDEDLDDWKKIIHQYVGIKVGENGAREEYLRILVKEERTERELCAKLCTQAIAAGLAERQVKIMEQQAKQVVAMFDRFAEGLGLTPEQALRVPEVAEQVLRGLPAGTSA